LLKKRIDGLYKEGGDPARKGWKEAMSIFGRKGPAPTNTKLTRKKKSYFTKSLEKAQKQAEEKALQNVEEKITLAKQTKRDGGKRKRGRNFGGVKGGQGKTAKQRGGGG